MLKCNQLEEGEVLVFVPIKGRINYNDDDDDDDDNDDCDDDNDDYDVFSSAQWS